MFQGPNAAHLGMQMGVACKNPPAHPICLKFEYWSQGPSPANDPDQQHDDRYHQQNVDETADGVGADQSQQPQYEQNNSDGIEHDNSPLRV